MLKRIGRYINLQPLGGGGMGQVFLAEHEILPGAFVVKVLNPALSSNPEAVERFKRECIIVAGLRHPNIVHCLEPGVESGVWYLPMEQIRGETLQDKIDSPAPLPPSEKVGWSLQILGALRAAHGARPRPVVHRDLKPSNIMVTPEGVVKLLDFGIAHEAGSELTREGNPGTFEFQAPEQIRRAPIDARTDLFSLGIVLYLLFTGRHPFKRRAEQSEFDTQSSILNEEPAPPSQIDPLLPPALDAVLLRALRKDPQERFASAEEMARALEALHAAGDEGADKEREAFVLKQLERARQLLEIGGAESVAEAAKFVRNAHNLLPEFPEVRLTQERVSREQGEIERIELLYDKARRALEARRFTEARSCLDLALSIRPNDSRLRKLDTELRTREGEAVAAQAAPAGSAPGAGERGEAEEDGGVGSGLAPALLRPPALARNERCVAALGECLERLEEELRGLEAQSGDGPPGSAVRQRLERWSAILDAAAFLSPLGEHRAALRGRLRRLGVEGDVRAGQAAGAAAEVARGWEI